MSDYPSWFKILIGVIVLFIFIIAFVPSWILYTVIIIVIVSFVGISYWFYTKKGINIPKESAKTIIEGYKKVDENLKKEQAKESKLIEEKKGTNNVINYLKKAQIPFPKDKCIEKGENWLQENIFTLMRNKFGNKVHREKVLADGRRIDFEVGSIGVEIKIFRKYEDFKRLEDELLHYKKEYKKIIIPYVNADGMSNEQLKKEMNLLKNSIREIKDFFPLNVKE